MHEEKNQQVKDNFQLLELMLEDMQAAPDLYKPTNYWSVQASGFLPELRSLGLRDFRRRRNSGLSMFGATDLLPITRVQQRLPTWKPFSISKLKERMLGLILLQMMKYKYPKRLSYYISKSIYGVTLQDIWLLCWEYARLYGEKNGAKSIRELDGSTVGNPENVFSVGENTYTLRHLYYYIQYAYVSRFVDFNSIDTMAEIGSGLGRQVEVIHKLHPHIVFYIFDIPPQLYVCEQYLTSLFGNTVVSYASTRELNRIPSNMTGGAKIFIFGTWKLPELIELNYDLFWNSASFHEMEPDIVLNYLKYVNRQANKGAFLNELMEGKKISAQGSTGVLEPTTIEHYRKGLSNFQIQDRQIGIFLPHFRQRNSFSFWKRIV